MNLKEFTIGVSQTFNLGSYESYKIEVSQTWNVPIEEQDDPRQWPAKWEEMKKKAQTELYALQKETYLAQQRKTKNGKGM